MKIRLLVGFLAFVSSIHADTINAKNFGAKGDGSQDDAPALRSALAWLNTHGGGALYIPAGNYYINSGTNYGDGYITALEVNYNTLFAWNAPKIKIYGDGKGTVLQSNAINFNILRIEGSSCEVSNLTIYAYAQSGTAGIILGPQSLTDPASSTFACVDTIREVQFYGLQYAVISQAAAIGSGGNFHDRIVDCDINSCL